MGRVVFLRGYLSWEGIMEFELEKEKSNGILMNLISI